MKTLLLCLAVVLCFWFFQWRDTMAWLSSRDRALAEAKQSLSEAQERLRTYPQDRELAATLDARLAQYRIHADETAAQTILPRFGQELEAISDVPVSALQAVPADSDMKAAACQGCSLGLQGSIESLIGILNKLDARRFNRLVRIRQLNWTSPGQISLVLDVYGRF